MIPAELIGWWRFEADGSSESGVGPNFSVIGSPSFIPGQHGNGVDLDANTKRMEIADLTIFPINAGCLEFWAKMGYANTDTVRNRAFYNIGSINVSQDIGTWFYYAQSLGIFIFQIWGPNVVGKNVEVGTTDFTWNAGDWLHFGLVWDKDGGLEGGKRSAIYINDADESVIRNSWNFDFSTEPIAVPNLFTVGKLHGSPTLDQADVIFDNMKLWNYAKTDFSDRFTEGYPTIAPVGINRFNRIEGRII